MLGSRLSMAMIARLLLSVISARAALTALSPLLDGIIERFALSGGEAGLLSALPLLCFVALSLATPTTVTRFGLDGALALTMLLLTVGALMRSADSSVLLFAGTLVCGAGAAACSVLLPAVIKRDFGHYPSAMSAYALLLTLGGGFASAVAYPLAQLSTLGWRFSLGIWSLPALCAAWLWLAFRLPKASGAAAPKMPIARLFTSPLAWQVALFFGFNTLTFFVVIAWLPAYLLDAGFAPEWSGALLGLMQIVAVPPGILIAARAKRPDHQRWLALLASFLMAAGFSGYALLPHLSLAWVVCTGLGGGACLSLSLQFMTLRTASTASLVALSTFSQVVGYAIAAAGSPLFGLAYDGSGVWSLPFLAGAAIAMLQGLAGFAAGRPRLLEEEADGGDVTPRPSSTGR